MPPLIWTPEALGDIDRLHAFLRNKDPNAAQRAVAAIRQGLKLLEQHPHVGRPVKDMPAEFRLWPIDFASSGYVAVYQVQDRTVSILAVRHGREHD